MRSRGARKASSPGQGRFRQVFLQFLPAGVLKDLADIVFPTYRTVRRLYPSERYSPAGLMRWLRGVNRRRMPPRLRELADSLRAWSTRWNLTEPWILEQAVWTMDDWCRLPESSRSWWGPGRIRLRRPFLERSERRLVFRAEGWEPARETPPPPTPRGTDYLRNSPRLSALDHELTMNPARPPGIMGS
jgi:hypothetical protein